MHPPFPTNALGMTYGNGAALTANGKGSPDLISAYARNGAFGYLKTSEFLDGMSDLVV
jgi:hypothetical protein